jgi:hypothetical protein
MPATRPPRRVSMSTSPFRLWAEDAVGYRPDDDVPEWQRWLLKIVIGGGAIAAGALTVWLLGRGELPRIPANTRTMLRLEDYTRSANSSVRNTMPPFLALPGDLGAIAADGQSIKQIEEHELSGVVCAPSLAVLVRQEFPGYYDQMADDKLEEAVLEKHPDYRDKLCALPAWMDVTPHDIIKYEMKPLPAFRTSVLLWSALTVASVVMLLLNLYYRVVVAMASAHAHSQTPISSFHSSGRA